MQAFVTKEFLIFIIQILTVFSMTLRNFIEILMFFKDLFLNLTKNAGCFI